jgi:hypothetical protein
MKKQITDYILKNKNRLKNDNSEEFKYLRKNEYVKFCSHWVYTKKAIDFCSHWVYTKKAIDEIIKKWSVKRRFKEFYLTENEYVFLSDQNPAEMKAKRKERAERKKMPKQRTLAQRLVLNKIARVSAEVNRIGFSDDHVTISDRPGDAVFRADYTLDWNGYSRRCKYPKKVWCLYLDIDFSKKYPKYKENDGWINLTCLSRKEIGSVTVEKVECCQKGRGNSLKIRKVFLATTKIENTLYSYHAETVKKAIKGLERKIKIATTPEKEKTYTHETEITRPEYARLTGACMFGIREFCKNHGLENVRKMKIKDILPMIEGEFGADKLKKIVEAK